MMNSTIKTWPIICITLLLFSANSVAQLPDECKLDIGTNLSGLADYGTELPFVDLMKNARTWYTKSIGDPNNPFDSGFSGELSYRSDGYPTHVPQNISNSPYPQKVVTIWAITDGWTPGEYTILWEGTGTLEFWGSHQNLQQTGDHRITFDFPNPVGGIFEMTIAASDINDPIHNIRVLLPNSESTYLDEPFNPVWLEKLALFKTLRFMDWGQTNNWGETEWDLALNPALFNWNERSQMEHYTWAYEKGIPYEMMVRLMNDYDIDGWVCIPHRASDEYIREMARFFRDELEPERHLTIEFSNEVWNFIFHQTNWLNEHGCIQQGGLTWPECIVPYVQNALDIFSNEFDGEMHRITRALGAFTGWPDVTRRIAENMTSGSFDALSPTFYFGFTEDGDAELDALGADATTADIARLSRQGMVEGRNYIDNTKEIADDLGVPVTFYEGGQHITPHPFGEEPTYAQALVDIMRDTAMYNLYNEWFDYLRTVQEGEEPLTLMHFGFVSSRSARYGSWGMLEFMNQDTSLIPAPKYSSILDNLAPISCSTTSVEEHLSIEISIFPNPTSGHVVVSFGNGSDLEKLEIFDMIGRRQRSIDSQQLMNKTSMEIPLRNLKSGVYFLKATDQENKQITKKLVLLN